MNKLIVVLCSIVLIWFSSVLLESPNDSLKNSNQWTSIELSEIKVPKKSILETQWDKELQAQEQQKKVDASKTPEQPVTPNGNLISIGNNAFELLGVFKQGHDSFVLLKSEEGQIEKAKQGQMLFQEIKVEAITANSVILSTAQQSKEFKLFRWQTDEQAK
ncbi:hypothetical protein HG263_14810 [Pseudoalteromonas sp. JBTF-M23]|uniref:Uncharacterized protein n=1 Tax=Pseudoalteromonas caenipelagi TaxID=2726988 RepID=A0A849VEV2_9GAMM|nr:hypothetical protein [Pseudoalteromonas caenipelagi]NOU51806.1 hypothetical protein [Pseudoalteromonas caenipelagi]